MRQYVEASLFLHTPPARRFAVYCSLLRDHVTPWTLLFLRRRSSTLSVGKAVFIWVAIRYPPNFKTRIRRPARRDIASHLSEAPKWCDHHCSSCRHTSSRNLAGHARWRENMWRTIYRPNESRPKSLSTHRLRTEQVLRDGEKT